MADEDFQPGDLVNIAPLGQAEFRVMYIGGGRWVNQYGSIQPVPDERRHRLIVTDPRS